MQRPKGLGLASFVVTTLFFPAWVAVGVVHALGHYAAARVLGVPTTLSLGLGSGNRVLGGLYALPRLDAVGPVRAALYLLAGPVTSFAAAWVFVALPHGGAALVGEPDRTAIVAHVVAGSAAERAGARAGDRLVALDGAPAAWWSDASPALDRDGSFPVVVERDGARVELRLDVPPGEATGLRSERVLPVAGEVSRESPAEAAGIRAGDRIARIDGVPIADWSEIAGVLARAVEGDVVRPVSVELLRDGAPLTVTVTPTLVQDVGGDGASAWRPLMGIAAADERTGPAWETRTATVGEAAAVGATRAREVLGFVSGQIVDLWLGEAPPAESLGGPVEIFRMVPVAPPPTWRWAKTIGMFLATGSLMLGVYNLLPLAWSDGFAALDEVLRRTTGRRLPHRVWVWGTVGFVLVLMGAIVVMDVMRALA